MNSRFLLFSFLVFTLPISGQSALPDTIPYHHSMLKAAGNYIIENSVDTVMTIVINEFLAKNSDGFFDEAGDDDDWFEILNYGDYPVALNGLWFTDDPRNPCKWKITNDEKVFLGPGEYMLFWADDEPEEGYNHTTFKLSGEGEYLGLFSRDTNLIDECSYGIQASNISYGRFPDGGLTWVYFDLPSPDTTNLSIGGQSILPLPVSNLVGGFYSDPILLKLTAFIEEGEIRYTTDCSDPDINSHLFTQPIQINTTTIIRARILKYGAIDGPILTLSFIFEADSFNNPVISLIADPDDLNGVNGLFTTAGSELEIPGNFEYIVNEQAVYSSGTGIQLHSVKNVKPYSMRLYARSRYGDNWFDYPFFKDNGPSQFKRFILRNGGNDNVNSSKNGSYLRDPLIETIAKTSNRNPMISESQPVNIFLNGKFYGIFNLREKVDQYYIESRTGVSENFDLLERAFDYDGNRNAIVGSWEEWDTLLAFVDTPEGLSREEDYKYLDSQVDIENFTDYWITEVFVGNFDWLSNNIKFWKPENGKWKWIYWDTDHGLGFPFSTYGEINWNTLEWALGFEGRAGATGYNNRLIRNLLKNESYKELLITRFTNLLNTSFNPEVTIPMLDSMKSIYAHDMVYHARKWQRSMLDWNSACNTVEDYLQARPDILFGHLKDHFGLGEPVSVSIKVDPPGSGIVFIEDQKVTSDTFTGRYFQGMKYSIVARPLDGFVFTEWSYSGQTEDSIMIDLTDSIEITAHFVIPDSVVPFQISEIYFNNRSSYDCGDWIEFYYYGTQSIDISEYYITGDNGELLFTFEKGAVIHPNEYFVVSENISHFSKVYPEPIRSFDKINSDISNHHLIALRSGNGEILREIEFMKENEGWPLLPAEGFSIELNCISDNSNNGENWSLSENRYGSPGLQNQLVYRYHRPRGKNVLYHGGVTKEIPFASSNDYYFDQDGHQLGGIIVNSISGAGVIKSDNMIVESGVLYGPSDFVYTPGEPFNDTTSLYYTLVDNSGEASALYSIIFIDLANSSYLSVKQELEVYPVPVLDYCIIKIPTDIIGPLLFNLFDMNGKLLKELKTEVSNDLLKIDMSEFGNGLYFYTLRNNDTLFSGKIVVIK